MKNGTSISGSLAGEQLGLTVRNRSVEGGLNRVPGGVGAYRTSRDRGSSEGCPGLDRPSTDQLLMCEELFIHQFPIYL
jgi:hypothetical protein